MATPDYERARYVSRKRIESGGLWKTICTLHGESVTEDGHCLGCKFDFSEEVSDDDNAA